MASVSIKSIFQDFWGIIIFELSMIYSAIHWSSIVENVEKMLQCREPSSGYAEYICSCCFEKRQVPFTCKSRFCTSCGKIYIDKWVEKTVEDIFDVPHRHLIFSIPEQLRDIIYMDRSLIKVMMDYAAKTALEVLQTHEAGVVPGILVIVHTFGRDLKFNPHVHMLLTEGGLTSNNEWVDLPFISFPLLRRKWQYYLLTEIKKNIPKTRENSQFIDKLFKKYPKGFYVNAKSKMTSARYAARYIGRYMARPALAEHKIVRYEGGMVTFWYIDHATNRKVYKTLKAEEFIKKLIDHIPLKGFKQVRHYGLYGRRSKKMSLEILQKCKRFAQMSFDFVTGAVNALTWRQRMINSFGKDPLRCPKCKKEMLLWRIWHPQYGIIFDLSRDAPAVEEKNKPFKKEQKGHTQLSLFPI